MFVDGIVWAETCGIYGGINVVISWKGGEREVGRRKRKGRRVASFAADGKGRAWQGRKEKEAFSLKCPSLPFLRFIACGCFATSER